MNLPRFIVLGRENAFTHFQNKLLLLASPCKDFDHTLHNMPFPEQGHLLVLANAAALILTLTAWPYTNRQKMKVTVIAKVHQTFCLTSS